MAEKNLTESSNLIAFLRYRVEQLESVNSASRYVSSLNAHYFKIGVVLTNHVLHLDLF